MQLSLPTDCIEQNHPSAVGLRSNILGLSLHSLAKGFGHQESDPHQACVTRAFVSLAHVFQRTLKKLNRNMELCCFAATHC